MKTCFVFSAAKSADVLLKKMYALLALVLIVGMQGALAQGQTTTVKTSLYSGYFVVGYVDDGGFSNFTGPNVTISRGNSHFVFSALPSLRYKVDRSEPTQNAFVTPALGAGFTYAYKMVAVQLATYYNTKTPTTDGQWHLGLGLGVRMAEFNKKK
jgi:hypothetical protein